MHGMVRSLLPIPVVSPQRLYSCQNNTQKSQLREITMEQDEGSGAPTNFIRRFLSRCYEFAELTLREPILHVSYLFSWRSNIQYHWVLMPYLSWVLSNYLNWWVRSSVLQLSALSYSIFNNNNLGTILFWIFSTKHQKSNPVLFKFW